MTKPAKLIVRGQARATDHLSGAARRRERLQAQIAAEHAAAAQAGAGEPAALPAEEPEE